MQRIILFGLSMLLAACGSPDSSERAPSAARAPGENVIGVPLEQSLDKARSVEDLTGQRKGGLDAAVEEAD